ncbi:hypothetical protein JYU34_016720 [Plutella xylostella]|uniref:Osteopetrosis-associated transmembrane protein 1 n=1 Tax=Plutella xylostella TaxID=51655 RepID=A0ABQ7Q3A9_PLUXY|nr:hypothetical protein JYU34_016720 [Plutella xylostella]
MGVYKSSWIIFTILINLSNHVLKADVSLLSFSGEGYVFPYPKECSDILDTFAQYASDFTLCSIQNARPIRLCEKCVHHYVNFHDKYQELMTTESNGTKCRSIFISQDRLDAILEYHDNILSVWNKGHCAACFEWTGEHPVVSNQTQKFNKMFNETMQCIVTNYNLNSTDICNTCMQSYLSLDEFYKTLSSDAIGVDVVCMDIVDSMNATRSIWSKTLNCCKLRWTPEIIFLCCSGIISSLPILFYLAVRYCGPIRDLPNVLRQSRFKQALLRRSK